MRIKQIVEGRTPEEQEDMSDLMTLNDIRNGMLVSNDLRPLIDKKKLIILKTPNRVLACTDIPPRSNNTDLLGDVEYSDSPRYTLQWLAGTEHQKRDVPNNMDAAFKKHSQQPKPSPLLRNYNYGVGALRWWGKGANCQDNIALIRTASADVQDYL